MDLQEYIARERREAVAEAMEEKKEEDCRIELERAQLLGILKLLL